MGRKHRRSASIRATVILLALAVAAPAAVAAPGDPDTNFDGDAKRLVYFEGTDAGHDVAIMPNGRILVVGSNAVGINPPDFAAARVLPNGAMDTSFSGDGIATIDEIGDPFANEARAVVPLPDGRAIVTGRAYVSGAHAFGTVRLLANGTPDTSFGTGGESVYQVGGDYGAFDADLAPDGDIIVAGVGIGGTSGDNDLTVMRLDPNGVLDTTFKDSGFAWLDGGSDEYGRALDVAPDGAMAMAGDDGTDAVVGLFQADGSPDPDFGTNGVVTLDLGGFGDTAAAVALEPDGDVLVAGTDGSAAIVVRLEPDGSPDTSFAGDGTFDFPEGTASSAQDLQLHHFGSILVAGDVTLPGPPADQQGLLFRLRPDGTLDPAFGGGDGWAAAGFAGRTDGFAGLSVGSNSIAVAGTSEPAVGSDDEMFVARFKDRAASGITVTVRKKTQRAVFKGKVSPNHAGQKVRVSYFRKKAGKWRLIARKSPTLNGSSLYSASFKRSKAKKCRVVAQFAADLDHLGSSKKAVFRC